MADVRLDLVVDADTIVYDGGTEVIKVDKAKKIQGVTISATPPTAGQALVATSDTTAAWSSTVGTVTGPGTSVVNNLTLWDNTGGSVLSDSGIAVSDVVLTGDSRLTNARTPTAHASSHADGGSDEINVTGLTGLLATAQTPIAHSTSHKHGGTDEVSTATAAANAIPKAGADNKLDIGWLPTGSTSTTVCIGNDSRLSNARTPTTHASTHEDGGADEISVAGLSGLLATPQTPATHATAHQNNGADEINVAGLNGLLADAQTPLSHASTHENGGADEIDVGGLSGVLADAQVASALRGDGWEIAVTGGAPSADKVLRAINATTASWQTIPTGGDTVGAASSTNNEVVAYSGTGGKTLKNTGILYTNLIVEGDSRLTDSRAPTAHASSHQNGGADEIATATASANAIPKAGGAGTLAIGWLPTGTSSSTVCIGDDSRLSNARTPTSHASSHQSGGGDQISIAGLSGRGASNQTADQIATTGTAVNISTTAPSSGQVLAASSATAAAWTTPTVAVGNVTGLGTNVGTFLATPSSANLAAAVTDETGSGALVFANSPTLVTPALGTPASGVLTNCTGRVNAYQTADQIATSGTAVTISSTAPTTGQILKATSATAASWQNESGGGVSPSGTAADGSVVSATGSSTSVWVPGTPRYMGAAEPWIARSPLPCITSTFGTISGRMYAVYVGQLVRTLPSSCFVNFYLSAAGSGSQAAEVYVLSTPSAGGGSSAQTVTVKATSATLSDITTTTGRIKRNSSGMDLSAIATGTHLWLGVRIAMASGQPTVQAISHDLARGYCMFGDSGGVKSVNNTQALDLGTDQLSTQFPELWLTAA